MAVYAAFLRGVMPFNCKMPELKRAFEAAGFDEVRTVLGSGNVVFTARAAGESALEKKAEAAMKQKLGRVFPAQVRPISALEELLATDPYATLRLAPGAKRVVTFLRVEPRPKPKLPVEQQGARIHLLRGREAFTTYVPGPNTPVFMALIEKTFGKDVTTRTWETVMKVAK